MSARSLAIIDYGAGNLRSIQKALEKVAAENRMDLAMEVTADPEVVRSATAVVLPGVGAAGPTMRRLEDAGLVDPIREAALDRPFLGVCLGMQLLYSHHEEGDVPGLGVLSGRVSRLPGGVKIPHMGWNVLLTRPHTMFEGLPERPYFYYVHSYYCEPENSNATVGVTEYGVSFCAALARGNLWATQFHPEKSGDAGLRLLSNFLRIVE